MITAAVPPPKNGPAFALSIALHVCGLAVLATLVPAAQATVAGHGMRDVAFACGGPCEHVFALRIEHRARPAPAAPKRIAATAPMVRTVATTRARAHRNNAAHTVEAVAVSVHVTSAKSLRITVPVLKGAQKIAVVASTGTNPNPTVATQPNDDVAAARIQPNTTAANPSAGVPSVRDPQPNAQLMGPGIFSSHYEPTLRDRDLYDEIVAKIGPRGVVVIAVDDQGRATEVKITAPGLDPASVDDLRKRLLAARYVPRERDGVSFDGVLRIAAGL